MGFLSSSDVLKKWQSGETFRAKADEVKQIRKDIDTAVDSIIEAKKRYIKKKLKLRSVKQAEEDPFAELADYRSKTEIQDAYGCEYISEQKMYQLWDLWDAREEQLQKKGKYSDRVTEMLDKAIMMISDMYAEELSAFNSECRKMEAEAAAFAEKNNEEERAFRYGRPMGKEACNG